MKKLLLIAILAAGSITAVPSKNLSHEWKLVKDETFFNYIDSMLDLNDSTPFIDMDPCERQMVQSAKRYYRITIDDGLQKDSITINDGKPHRIHIAQFRWLMPDAKSTIKHKDRVYFFTVDHADVFRSFHPSISKTSSKSCPCLPGQEWQFEYTAQARP
ncbi:MAG: hypothetical protein K2M06_03530 [Muribaculaceae bacterium]|nr:hypothetical protein [Muribaculaceae bacterium]